jgi:hypothetical protein
MDFFEKNPSNLPHFKGKKEVKSQHLDYRFLQIGTAFKKNSTILSAL